MIQSTAFDLRVKSRACGAPPRFSLGARVERRPRPQRANATVKDRR
jgi:hypothetical protein